MYLTYFPCPCAYPPTDPDEQLVPSLLDDKRLSATFEHVVEVGPWGCAPVDRARFSMAFVECLLQVRYLFDRCAVEPNLNPPCEEGHLPGDDRRG